MLCHVIANMARLSPGISGVKKIFLNAQAFPLRAGPRPERRNIKMDAWHQFCCSPVRPKGTSLYLHVPNMPSVTKGFLPSSQEENKSLSFTACFTLPTLWPWQAWSWLSIYISERTRPAQDCWHRSILLFCDLALEADGVPASFTVWQTTNTSIPSISGSLWEVLL